MNSASGVHHHNNNWSFSGSNNHFVNSTTGRKLTPGTTTTTTDGKKSTPVPPIGECYFWRTTGCRNGLLCKYSHDPQAKGIDLKPFMKKTPAS